MRLNVLNRRRIRNFRANKRGWWSLWLFLLLFAVSLGSELIASDRPIVVLYKGEWLFPIVTDYPESKFGGFLATTNFRDPANRDEVEALVGELAGEGVRFVWVTHDRAQLRRLGTDAIVLGDGMLLAAGPIAALADHADPRVRVLAAG